MCFKTVIRKLNSCRTTDFQSNVTSTIIFSLHIHQVSISLTNSTDGEIARSFRMFYTITTCVRGRTIQATSRSNPAAPGQSSPRHNPATELQDTQDKSYGRRAKSRSTSFFVCRNITMPCGNATRNFSPRRYPRTSGRFASKNFYLPRCLCQNRGARYRFKPDHGLTGRQ